MNLWVLFEGYLFPESKRRSKRQAVGSVNFSFAKRHDGCANSQGAPLFMEAGQRITGKGHFFLDHNLRLEWF